MLLRFNRLEDDLERHRTHIDPRRTVPERRVIAPEYQLPHDLLHPGRAGLAIGRHHDVIVAETHVFPSSGVADGVLDVARLHGKIHRLHHHSMSLSTETIAQQLAVLWFVRGSDDVKRQHGENA